MTRPTEQVSLFKEKKENSIVCLLGVLLLGRPLTPFGLIASSKVAYVRVSNGHKQMQVKLTSS